MAKAIHKTASAAKDTTDYQGNNRMVVNGSGGVEQVTHYYPYGGVIGDISTDGDFQKNKFLGKELDRKFGLDWYDDEARMYDAIGMPRFTSIDPLAEKYYHLSPYSYCGGDPVNKLDNNGRNIYRLESNGRIKLDKETPEKYDLIMAQNNTLKINHYNGVSLVEGLSKSSNNNTIRSSESSSSEMVNLFFFLADNTDCEWSISGISTDSNKLGGYIIGTNFSSKNVTTDEILSEKGYKDSNTWFQMHSHPDSDGTKGGSIVDSANYYVAKKESKNGLVYLPFVYHKYSQNVYRYNESAQSTLYGKEYFSTEKGLSILLNLSKNKR